MAQPKTVSLPLPRDLTFDPNDWRILSRFWHPFAYSDELSGGKPVGRTLLDEPLVGYRTSGGQAVVARDLCIHRGVPLSLGWVEGEELVCAYHGFRYGKDGACTRIPAQAGKPPPASLCLQTLPVVERYGIVWVCPGGEADAPLPDWPQAEDGADGWRRLRLDPQEWDASAPRQLENFLDVAHFSWIHTGTFGNREQPEVAPYEVKKTAYGCHVEYPYLAANPDHAKLDGAESPGTIQRHMIYDLHLPLACRLLIEYGGDKLHGIFDIAVPVHRDRVRIFFFISRNFDHHVPAETLLAWERNILSEDKPIVERQRPEELPLDLSEEFHLRFDRFSTAYRRGLKALGLGKPLSS
ncbi:MAG: Rieske 2Fe-2S domain-containing protein [Opitutales bacterium]